ncbi:MAG: hypothetical protein PHH65_08330 [Eubacteriales bacterium]|nr:hypothetical protein [Eubacteriales bacterium]
MAQIKIAHTEEIVHQYKEGFSAVPFLEGAYDQARFEKCSLQPGHSVSPEVYGIAQNNQLFIFLAGKGYVTTPEKLSISQRLPYLFPSSTKNALRSPARRTAKKHWSLSTW